MSALAIILTAAMAIPSDGSGREKVSAEMAQTLDLSGEWEGVLQSKGFTREVTLTDGKLHWITIACALMRPNERECPFKVIDEGKGHLRINLRGRYSAIYRQKYNQVVICLRAIENGRPISFSVEEGQQLLILHRVKSRK